MNVDEVRRTMEAAMGKLSPAKAQDLAKSMMQGQGREQVTKTAKDLLEWSNRNRERLSGLIRSEVRAQLKTLGVASRDEVDSLRKRVRELERAGKPAAKRSTAKRSSAKRATSKSAASKPASTPASATPEPTTPPGPEA